MELPQDVRMRLSEVSHHHGVVQEAAEIALLVDSRGTHHLDAYAFYSWRFDRRALVILIGCLVNVARIATVPVGKHGLRLVLETQVLPSVARDAGTIAPGNRLNSGVSGWALATTDGE